MDYNHGKYQVIKKNVIAKGMFDMTILCPDIANKAVAGQFVHILAEGFQLRRPISICGIDKDNGTIRIVFEVRGKGTKEISDINEGELIDMLAPLGNGFNLTSKDKKAIVIGGGIGVPPMLAISDYYKENATAIIGFRTADLEILSTDFQMNGSKLVLCTDDGTKGVKGYVTDALRKELEGSKPDIIYACGPHLMLKGIIEIANEFNIQCQVSLEERMACGVGACLVCACRTVKNGEEYFAHVCKDGPVFDSKEVIL